jgi:hypothetical protein
MNIVGLGIEIVIQTAFLTAAMWVLIKLQKLQYNFPGLLGAAALASAFDQIPFVGHYFAFVALVLTMMKVTREDFTGIVFTIAISYALTFGMNLWLLGSLMGDLRISARSSAPQEQVTQVSNDDDEDAAPAKTNKTQTFAAKPIPSPVAAPSTDASTNSSSSSVDPKAFVIKSVIKSPKTSTAMIAAGDRTYVLIVGESAMMDTPAGKVPVRLDQVKDNSVILNVGGERLEVPR